MNYARGSTWRKWDLHFHTPSSPDYDNGSVTNEDIIKVLKDNEIALVAITDHHNIDVERISELKKIARDEITILPGIEFCSDLGGSESIHFIGIFPEDSDYSNVWLSMQGKLNLTPKDIKKRGGYNKIYCKLDETSEIIHNFGGIVTIHAGRKSHTVENITNALPYKQAQKSDILRLIDIFEVGQSKDIKEYISEVYPNISKQPPMILCSDNHDVTKYSLKDNCWIKADPTFTGLKQVINEPFVRVYVGEYPPIFKRVKNNKTKYIKSIFINKSRNSNLDEEWFKKINVVFNSELVSVIGNKGSGKSALLDIVGLVCNSKNIKDFSFLNEEKFRDSRNNLSKHFVAKIVWENVEESDEFFLSDNPKISSVDRVKYIPQKYLESLCSDRDDKFEKELKKVIFSHIPEEDRLGIETLDEIINYHSEIVIKKIESIKADISRLNFKIIRLESFLTEKYRREIEAKLEQKKLELRAHLTVKPKEAKKPPEGSPKDILLDREIKNQKKKLGLLEKELEEKKRRKATLKEKVSLLKKIIEKLEDFQFQYYSLNKELQDDLATFNIKVEDVLFVKVKNDTILKLKKEFENKLKFIEKELDPFEEDSLINKLTTSEEKIKNLQEQLDKPFKLYQGYLHNLKKWDEKKLEIEGNPLKEGTIKYYEERLKYLDDKAKSDLDIKREERLEKVREIFKQKKKLKEIFESLYQPVKTFISQHNASNPAHQVQFDVSLGIKENFSENFLSYINQRIKGSFYGIDEGKKFLAEIIDSTNFNEDKSVIEFLRIILYCLECDTRDEKKEEREIHHQINSDKLLDFYSFLYSLDYVEPYYKLKFGNKDLSLLSPGEKGALILIFYLLIDKDDIPLIMDQPEENLDNQSVYELLVPYVKEAKKRRQIIIATHNPNLAVVCDSEQVIHSDIAKFKGCKVTYTSGSIENPMINDKIVKVLEGTMPAFRNRDRKYIEVE